MLRAIAIRVPRPPSGKLSNSPKPGASIPSHDWFRNCAPTRVVSNNGLKNVGLENMAINSTHFQWPDLDDFCATVFATTPSRFEVSGTRLNTGDSFKWKQRLENKRHTNTHLAMRLAVTVSGSKRSPSGSVSAEQSSRKIRKNRSGEFSPRARKSASRVGRYCWPVHNSSRSAPLRTKTS